MSSSTTEAIQLPTSSGDRQTADQFRALLPYAVLAPSSHNSQPWKFEIAGNRLRVFADPDRWLRVADSDRRELYLSVGCALENLLVAAEHFGFAPEVSYFPSAEATELVAEVSLARDIHAPHTRRARLFSAIRDRHTNHRRYDVRPLGAANVAALEALAGEEGIRVHLTTDAGVRREAEQLVVRADALQFADPAWRQELAGWLAQGVFGTGWLMSKMSALAVGYLDLGTSTGKKDLGLLQSAAALGVVTAERPDRVAQVLAGQVFERVFLAATDRGIQLQPMNQVLQVPEIRARFEDLLPREWGVPQITFRLGFAEAEGHTPRRPLEEMLR
jgi:hypothetical protein